MVFAVYAAMISVGGLFFPLTYTLHDTATTTPLILDGILPVVFWETVAEGNRRLIGGEILLVTVISVIILLLLFLKRIRSAAWPIITFFGWFVALFVMGGRVGADETIGMTIDPGFETYLAWSSAVFFILLTAKGLAHLVASQEAAFTK